jgi:hypothetical protein
MTGERRSGLLSRKCDAFLQPFFLRRYRSW